MNQKQAGMTLIEVIAAIALLSIVILTFAYVFIQSQQVTTNNGDRLNALQLAQKELSQVLSAETPPVNSGSTVSSPTASPLHTDFTIKVPDEQNSIYKTYVYVLNKGSEDDQLLPIVVRTYYNDTKYVELYNYYTITSN
ncbi:type II secretion system protein [Sporolactobacillus terrae]|uniref:type II secretion system protein n=1 Tax=Sporolactobacillus terrae TaxID=269673 RepID=UPI000AA39EB2|nr:type II secretion system protein [Sporolactobacillus terrae]